MGRFHIHSGPLIFWLTLSVAGCGPDMISGFEEGESLERACARPQSKGYWNDGRKRNIGGDRHVCLCISEEEFESQSRLDELNMMLLEDCRLTAAGFDFDGDDCDEDYAAKTWIGPEGEGERVTWPTGPVTNPPGSQVECH